MVASASAIASAIRGASTTPVEFTQMIEKDHLKTKIILPSPDFQRLCLEQLDLFRQIVDPNAVLSVSLCFFTSLLLEKQSVLLIKVSIFA